jgi:hypothetical protein
MTKKIASRRSAARESSDSPRADCKGQSLPQTEGDEQDFNPPCSSTTLPIGMRTIGTSREVPFGEDPVAPLNTSQTEQKRTDLHEDRATPKDGLHGSAVNSPRLSAQSSRATAADLEKRKAASARHEKRVARLLHGRQMPGSGSLGQPGDVKTETFLISCKQTEGRTLRINVADLEQIVREAENEHRTPLMAFETTHHQGGEQDWAMLPVRALLGLLARHHRAAGAEREDDAGGGS